MKIYFDFSYNYFLIMSKQIEIIKSYVNKTILKEESLKLSLIQLFEERDAVEASILDSRCELDNVKSQISSLKKDLYSLNLVRLRHTTNVNLL
jgi:hypothetical protein